MPSSRETVNGLTNIRLEKWHVHSENRTVFAWRVADPTEKRTPDEIYGVRIDVPVGEVEGLPAGQLLRYMSAKLNVALLMLDKYRINPPPLNEHLRKESDAI